MSPSTTYDNAAPLDGWQVTPKCCGLIATSCVCETCRQYVPKVPPLVELGEN